MLYFIIVNYHKHIIQYPTKVTIALCGRAVQTLPGLMIRKIINCLAAPEFHYYVSGALGLQGQLMPRAEKSQTATAAATTPAVVANATDFPSCFVNGSNFTAIPQTMATFSKHLVACHARVAHAAANFRNGIFLFKKPPSAIRDSRQTNNVTHNINFQLRNLRAILVPDESLVVPRIHLVTTHGCGGKVNGQVDLSLCIQSSV